MKSKLAAFVAITAAAILAAATLTSTLISDSRKAEALISITKAEQTETISEAADAENSEEEAEQISYDIETETLRTHNSRFYEYHINANSENCNAGIKLIFHMNETIKSERHQQLENIAAEALLNSCFILELSDERLSDNTNLSRAHMNNLNVESHNQCEQHTETLISEFIFPIYIAACNFADSDSNRRFYEMSRRLDNFRDTITWG